MERYILTLLFLFQESIVSFRMGVLLPGKFALFVPILLHYAEGQLQMWQEQCQSEDQRIE